ncbi:MAG: hypothetical protein JW982_08160 [Spirochaetes bacterium]|nr:hypothetical protein [Spirochaetota bacterium]
MISKKVICMLGFLVLFSGMVFASDMSEAEQLRKRCETEYVQINICVTNFGDAADKENLAKGEKMIKLAKVKMAQTKYPDSIALFNDYIKLQYALYASLADKYLERTDMMMDEIAIELVDFIDNKKVDQYLKMASQNIKDAKSNKAQKYDKVAIDHCRTAKKYLLACYGAAGKAVPEQYKIDAADNNLKTL